MLPARPLQVLARSLGACAALAASVPLAARAQAPLPPLPASIAILPYDQLRATSRATRVDSPDQVSDLRNSLAGTTVELSARIAGVITNRHGRSVLLQYKGSDGGNRTFLLEVSPQVLADAASMRALRADANVRILAQVGGPDAESMLVMLAATDKAAPTSLFREEDGGDVVIMAPVNGALPMPEMAPQLESQAAGSEADSSEPEASAETSELPQIRVPIVKRAPIQEQKAAPRPARKSPPAPRGYLAPPPSIPSVPSAVRAVPPLMPVAPSVYASAQKRAPSKPASRGGSPANRGVNEPLLFADDERIESQVPAYQNLVRRFNKKLSEAQVEEIARALLTAGYRQNMDPRFLAAIIAVESDFDIYCLSSSGAMGLGQIMPFNLPEVGMQKADAWVPSKNVLGTAMLLRGHLDDFKGRPNGTLLAVAAYNAGPNAVKRAGYKVPKGAQVQRYVWKVYYRYKEFAPELFR